MDYSWVYQYLVLLSQKVKKFGLVIILLLKFAIGYTDLEYASTVTKVHGYVGIAIVIWMIV